MKTKSKRASAFEVTFTAVFLLLSQFGYCLPLSAVELFAELEHSDSLAPLNSAQPRQDYGASPGTPVPVERGEDSERIPSQPMAPRVEWFMIPGWLAGQWAKKGDLTVSVTNLNTGRTQPTNIWIDDEMTVTWGHQVDRTGAVWHANFLPSERDAVSDGKSVRFLTTSLICERVDARSLVTRSQYLVTETTRGQIVASFRQESLNFYGLARDGELDNPSSNRVFTDRGQPLRDGKLSTRYTRVSNFQPLASDRGVNLLESLKQYLLSNGMPQRVPVNN